MNAPFIWRGQEDCGKNKVRHAQLQSDLAAARLQGWKIRAQLDPPTAAPPGFPYQHRTCAEWSRWEAWAQRQAERA